MLTWLVLGALIMAAITATGAPSVLILPGLLLAFVAAGFVYNGLN